MYTYNEKTDDTVGTKIMKHVSQSCASSKNKSTIKSRE